MSGRFAIGLIIAVCLSVGAIATGVMAAHSGGGGHWWW
jgi:hypothetical protein